MQSKRFGNSLRMVISGALAVVLSAPAVHGSLITNLIGYWHLDGDGADASGNGRNLTLFGGVGFASGRLGTALDLHHDNSQYAALLTDNAVFDFGASDFTIQTWVNYNTSAYEQTLIEKFTGGGGPDWTLTTFQAPTVTTQFYVHGGPSLDGSASLAVGTWHQIVARRSGNSFELFSDNNLVASGSRSGALTSTSNPLLIGRRNDGDVRDFSLNGRLDEIAVWNRALSNSEIGGLYNDGAGALIPEPTALTLLGLGALTLALYRLRRRRQTGVSDQAAASEPHSGG